MRRICTTICAIAAMTLLTFVAFAPQSMAEDTSDTTCEMTGAGDEGCILDDGSGGGMDNSGEDLGSDPGPTPGDGTTSENLGDTIAGPNFDNPAAYTTIGFVHVPDGSYSLDANGARYSNDQARAIDQTITDAVIAGSFGHYTTGTWVPYNATYGGFHDWFSDVLGWYPSCIPYDGVKAAGGLTVPDGALCFSGWRP